MCQTEPNQTKITKLKPNPTKIKHVSKIFI